MSGKRIAEMSRAELEAERARNVTRKRNERAAAAQRRAASSELYRILVIPDCHHPYADELAWNTCLEAARVVRPNCAVIIGDFPDCYAVTSHTKDPSRRRAGQLAWELDRTDEEANRLQAIGLERVEYVEGNHETRLTRYIAEHAPELDGLGGLCVRDRLRIDKRGWGWTPYKESLRIGEMSFTHDVERCGVHTARQSVLDYGDNVTIGHSHRAGIAYVGSARGSTHVGLNVGWLGDYSKVDYRHRDMARREWQHGFGWITQTPDGVSWCQFVPIINGVCVVDGQLIRGRVAQGAAA